MIRESKFPKAKSLRAQGRTFQAIADELGVGERTVRLWFAAERKAQLTPTTPSASPWPPERALPNEWTPADIERRTGWDSAFVARLIPATMRMERDRKRWAPWFVHLWIEETERLADLSAWQPLPEILTDLPLWLDKPPDVFFDPRGVWVGMTKQTAAMLAGLQVLEVWLDEPACGHLRRMVSEQKPFLADVARWWGHWLCEPDRINPKASETDKQQAERLIAWYQSSHKSFGAASRTHVRALRQRVEDYDLRILLGLPVGTQSDSTPALIEIANRLPMVDLPVPLSTQALIEIANRRPMVDLTVFLGGSQLETTPRVRQTVDLSRLALWQLFMQVFIHEPMHIGGTK